MKAVVLNGDVRALQLEVVGGQVQLGMLDDLYPTTLDALVDAHVFDFGVVQLYIENGKVCIQRCLPSEIRWDPLDALYGRPATTYRRRFERKAALIARFARKGS